MTNQQTILKLAPDFHIACHSCEQRMTVDGLAPFSQVLCPNCNAEITVPVPFQGYLLEEIIGTGSMATVYRGLDHSLNRDIAIKILNQEMANDEEKVNIFLTASRKASLINHQNVVSVFSCGDTDGTPYITTEMMRGGSLALYLSQHGKLTNIKQAIEITKQISAGMQQVHNSGLIYSDFSPSDIFLDEDMNAKISDIGVVNLRWEKHGIFESYMSPERTAKGEITELSDIYSIGATLYHMLTGNTPSANTVINPHNLNPKICTELSDLIMESLSKEPCNRPQSPNELINKLESIKEKTMSAKKFTVNNGPKSKVRKPIKAQKSNGAIKIFAVLFIMIILSLVADFMRGDKSLLFAKKEAPKTGKSMVFAVEPEPIKESAYEPTTTNVATTEKVEADIEVADGTVKKPTRKRRVKTLERPRPKGIDFPKRKNDLAKYIKSFPTKEAQDIEKKRINTIAEALPELSKLLSSNPYQPDGKIVIQRKLGGNKLLEERCISVKGNASEIVLKKPKGKTLHLKWSEVPLHQIVKFYEYYINQRLQLVDMVDEDHKAEVHDSAVDSTIRVALLTDWYGDTDTSKKYTKWVIKLSPEQKPYMKQMLPYQFR